MQDIKDILTDFNYPFKDMGTYINFPALWRNGSDETSVAYYKDKNLTKDFVVGEVYNLKQLISLIIGDEIKANDYIKGKNMNIDKIEYKEKLKVPEFFDPIILKDLIPDTSYWEARSISKDICELYGIGLCLDSNSIMGKMMGRSVIPIWNNNEKLVGLVGRDITDKHRLKYKILGEKKNFIFSGAINGKIITETKEVFLIESPADSLYLHSLGIRNTLCMFGVECSFGIINYLLKKNPKHIYICTNFEPDNGNIGGLAAEKIYGRLKKYFNLNQIKIHLPPCKDFAICSKNEVDNWYGKRHG